MTSIFKKIINGVLPANKIFEDNDFIVIEDINPVAPVHLLIIPKKEIKGFQDILVEDHALMTKLVSVVQNLAIEYKISDGYRLLTNNGSQAGQTVFHLHFHLIGAAQLGSMV